MFFSLFSLFSLVCQRRVTKKIETRDAPSETVLEKHQNSSQKQAKMAYNVTRYTTQNGLRITALENPDGTVKLLRFGQHTWGKCSMASYQNLNALKASYPPVEEKAPAPRSTVLRYIDDQGERVTALVLPDGKVRILRYGAVTWRTARTTATYESVEELHKYVKPREEAEESTNSYEPGTIIRGTSWVGPVTGLVLRNGSVRILRQGSHTHRNGKITNGSRNVAEFLNTFKLENVHATFRG